uniref:Uncharacterized protein n=1 Tax=Eutreptiella gymnastica TaxID=73025 RepID=A0A7S1NFD2_9EUGL|mmetsp:Transcript_2747/g.4937  ORF Transcript_2747/g.4937 Transcript_2747/m.4937 type:complete len:115 (+) Transcript_2747:462-806(+)
MFHHFCTPKLLYESSFVVLGPSSGLHTICFASASNGFPDLSSTVIIGASSILTGFSYLGDTEVDCISPSVMDCSPSSQTLQMLRQPVQTVSRKEMHGAALVLASPGWMVKPDQG